MARKSAAYDGAVEELRAAARAVGFEVREEELLREVGYRARSGACRVGGRELILLDRRLTPADRVEVLRAALAGRDLENVYLSPAVRALVTRQHPPSDTP
jgi:hypothetical protein